MTVLYRGYVTSLVLLCLLCPLDKAFCSFRSLDYPDSVEHFFDQVELWRWSGQFQLAVNRLEQFSKSNSLDDFLRLRTENELAENLRRLKNGEASLSILRRAEKSYDVTKFSDKSEYLRLILNKAKAYRSKSMNDSAEFNYNLAIELADKFGYKRHEICGEIWMDWAFYMTEKVSDIQTGIEYNQIAQQNYRQSLPPFHIKNAMVFYELASQYREIGDFERGANCARLAELIYSYNGPTFDHLVLNSRSVQANCFFENGDYQMANKIFDVVIERIDNDVQAKVNDFIRMLFSNGEALLYLGETQRAKNIIERSIKINQLEDVNDSVNLAFSYVALSDVELQYGDHENVERLLSKALIIQTYYNGNKNQDVADVYSYMGRNYEEQGRYNLALNNYHKAIIAAIKYFNSEDVYVNPLFFDSIQKKIAIPLIFDKARGFIKKYREDGDSQNQKRAFELYNTAYRLIREAANESMMEESLLEIQQYHEHDLNLGLECALEIYRQSPNEKYLNELMQFIETNKYFLLQNSIRKSRAKEVLGIPDSAYQKERQLLEQINTLKQEINNAQFQNIEEEYQARYELFDVTRNWEKLRKNWSNSTQSDFSFHELDNEISIESLRKGVIGDRDLLVEYFQTSDTLYTLAITSNKTEIFQVLKTEELDKQIDIYINHLHQNDESSPEDFRKFVHAANYLYRTLLQPILSAADLKAIDGLTIVPDGRLSLIPFESLIQTIPAASDDVNYFALDYLCKDYIVNYAYSLNILIDNLNADKDVTKKEMVAFSYSSSTESPDSSARDDQFGELPFSAIELRKLKKRIPKANYLAGDNATEYNFKSLVQGKGIIHLALHGEADTVDMLNSMLIFKEAGDSKEDGFLYAHELYGIDMSKSQMAVLSACETGIGKRMEGEGVYSLARGFVYAGCPSIVMSLWKVNDQTTADIMDHFYGFLAEGLEKDEALQMAKLAYINNSDDFTAHPANWAAFITLGNSDPVDLPRSLMQWYHWVFIFSVIVMVIFFAIRMRKKRMSV